MQRANEWLRGSIRWFDPMRRYGFVIPDDGGDDVFLYWRELRKSGIRESDARDGVSVEFQAKAPDKPGRCALQVSQMRIVR